jgi:hypothetical protein
LVGLKLRLGVLAAAALVPVCFLGLSARASGVPWRSGRVTQIGYDSCSPGAVKCGPPMVVEIGRRTVTLSHRGRLRISVSNVVSNQDQTQAARIGLVAEVGNAAGSGGCSASASIAAHDRGPVACRFRTRVLGPGGYVIHVYENAFGEKIATVRAYASHVEIVFHARNST